MKYCSQCESEYENSTTVCADCGSEVFRDKLPETVQLFPETTKTDSRQFVTVEVAENPLSMEKYVNVLSAAHIPVLSISHQWSPLDSLSSAWLGGWWEISVPEELAERAMVLVAQEKHQIETWAAENAQAAEAEALQMADQGASGFST